MMRSISMLGLMAVFVGCASAKVPPARVASTENVVQSARESGADRVPDANTHLQMAEENLQKAKSLDKKGKAKEAEAYLTRADSDARLASALSREAEQKARTDASVKRVHELQAPQQQQQQQPTHKSKR